MKSSLPLIIRFRTPHMSQTTCGHQPAREGIEPADTCIRRGIWRDKPVMADPGQTVVIVACINDIQSPVRNHTESQSATCIDPGTADASAPAVIDHRGLYTSDLAHMGYLVTPLLKWGESTSCLVRWGPQATADVSVTPDSSLQLTPVSLHPSAEAESRTASHTFCVSCALLKVGLHGSPVSSDSRKSAT